MGTDKQEVKKEKKHQKIRKEIERMREADTRYCDMNSCEPTDFMQGKTMVYDQLEKFINNL